MRKLIFMIATVLSSFGFFENIVAITVIGYDTFFGGIIYLLVSICAWAAYWIMGQAWIDKRNILKLWPIGGTLAGVLALNGGGTFFLSASYSIKVMFIPAILVSPAIAMALWLVWYHLSLQKR